MATLGSYNIEELIGEGGFGRTYRAHHVLNPRILACLKQNIDLTSDDRKILAGEAELMARIHHHSLPAFRDLYEVGDGSIVLAMTYIAGKPLDQSIAKHTAIDAEAIAWVTQRSLNALYYLHHRGVIHGDVKPGNIIVQPKIHNAILVDYGLSSVKPKSDSKAVGCTPAFAAPEILDGKPPLPQSDFYSLGLTMIHALGGDIVGKTMPTHVPEPLQEYILNLVRYNPMDRVDPAKVDLVALISDVRLASFGRRHSA